MTLTSATPTTDTRAPERVFASLAGITAIVVLLQFVFAGVFLRFDGKRDASSTWINAHAWGAHIGTTLAVATAAYAVWRLRTRRDLVVGSVLLAAFFLVEAYIGGAIRDSGKDSWTMVHVPLAFAITALVVWLPVRARA
jgi:heme A synthase